MAGERAWVETVKADLREALPGKNISIETGHRLPYALNVSGYLRKNNKAVFEEPFKYQTDLLIVENAVEGDNWVPRVVVEFKLGVVTTHDALTYSAKAATHKSVHPYLRYGIIVGGFNGPVPKRILRHGSQFDFMMTLASEALTKVERTKLVRLLKQEIKASRTISALISEKSDIRLLHRRLMVSY